MEKDIRYRLENWAAEYETSSFIPSDPVSIPHRHSQKRDIETSGLLTAVLSFGRRDQILAKASLLDEMMLPSPYEYIMCGDWRGVFDRDGQFYRMVSYRDILHLMEILFDVYSNYEDLESAVLDRMGGNRPIDGLCSILGKDSHTTQKKLNMFLRWMVRRDSQVDFGIWRRMDPALLIIPLDTHVAQMACILGLVDKAQGSYSNAVAITSALSSIWPDDPIKGDFALFGYGVTHTQEEKKLKKKI